MILYLFVIVSLRVDGEFIIQNVYVSGFMIHRPSDVRTVKSQVSGLLALRCRDRAYPGLRDLRVLGPPAWGP